MKRTKGRANWRFSLPRIGSAGSPLLDTVLALTMFTIVGSAVLSGVSTLHRAGGSAKAQSIAVDIARNQMASVLAEPYKSPPSTYTPITGLPSSDFTVTAEAQVVSASDTSFQKVVITVTSGGKSVVVLETYRTKE